MKFFKTLFISTLMSPSPMTSSIGFSMGPPSSNRKIQGLFNWDPMPAPTFRERDENKLPAPILCLDIQCGIGDTTNDLKKTMGDNTIVVGMDTDAGSIQRASVRYPDIYFVQGHPKEIIFEEESFDFIQMRGSLLNLWDKEKAFARLYSILRKGGQLLLEDYDETHPYLNEVNALEEQQLQIMKKPFNILDYDPYSHVHIASQYFRVFKEPTINPFKSMLTTLFVKD